MIHSILFLETLDSHFLLASTLNKNINDNYLNLIEKNHPMNDNPVEELVCVKL